MATSVTPGDFSRLPGNAAKTERERKRQADVELKRAMDNGVDLGSALLELFTTLPAAMVAAEKAEHKRVVDRFGEQHASARAVEASLERLERLEAAAAQGRARAVRAIEALRRPGAVFHGFVSNEDGQPMPNVRVSLVGEGLSGQNAATTEPDGYFAVPMPGRPESRPEAGDGPTASVVILDRRGETLYEDPVPLEIQAGSVYREYRLSD